MGKIIGIILIIAGLLACGVSALIMYVPTFDSDRSVGAATLGFGLTVLVLVLPLLGVGTFLLWHGRRESAANAHIKQQRHLLNIVKSRGQIEIEELVLELNSSREQVRLNIYDLVGKGLFSGYINWEKGVLYSQQASQLRQQTNCFNCSGQLELAGKGVIRCPFCGAEYFL